jgi:AcrR family transcriptional regulator
MMATGNVDKRAKKLEILRAAAKSFAKNGVAKTKMEDIAIIAGVGKGTIYEYFRSKEDIFIEAHNQFHKEIDKIINGIVESDYAPDIKLKMLVDMSLNLFLKKKNKISIIATNELAGIMMEFWSKGIREGNDKLINPLHLKNIYRKFRKILAGILDDGISRGIFKKMDTRLSASVLLAILDGIPLQRIIDPKAFRRKEIGETIIDNILYGIRK